MNKNHALQIKRPFHNELTQVAGHTGKVLVRCEPVASVVIEALEGFASGRFQTKSEVKHFLDRSPHYSKDNSGEVRYQRVTDLLNKVIYTGYYAIPSWNIALTEGKHEALINFETWEKIQARLTSKAKTPTRAVITR